MAIWLNRKIAKQKPWTTGLYEGIIAVDVILNQKLEQKNRISLILLDSILEIAFKEYLVNESEAQYSEAALSKLFIDRTQVQNEINRYVAFDSGIWAKIGYYYRLRCKLVHERATVQISDQEIEDYREVVQTILNNLFKLQF